MDAASIGALIAALRKKSGLTQTEFAKKLNVSNKAVSRWESGAGYPEVTQFPAIASLFGVTVDYLMTGKRKGIAFAGNIIADIVKTVDRYPSEGMLAHITESKIAVGGCVPNTSINLAKIDRNLPISTIGRVGDDEYGRFALLQMSRYGIDCSRVQISKSSSTSYCDVINVLGGERTFFTYKGASSELSPLDIDLSGLNSVILHVGYLMLLDGFDKPDGEYGTAMARFLHSAQKSGLLTSIDVVSDSDKSFKNTVIPSLRYCDYVTINELEASMLTDTSPYNDDGSLNIENVRIAMREIAAHGVKSKVIVHCKRAAFCLDCISGEFTAVPSLDLPHELIRGSVGAGDAFCAGALYAIYHNYTDEKILEFASSAAACSLLAENSVDGMLEKSEIYEFADKYGRITI